MSVSESPLPTSRILSWRGSCLKLCSEPAGERVHTGQDSGAKHSAPVGDEKGKDDDATNRVYDQALDRQELCVSPDTSQPPSPSCNFRVRPCPPLASCELFPCAACISLSFLIRTQSWTFRSLLYRTTPKTQYIINLNLRPQSCQR